MPQLGDKRTDKRTAILWLVGVIYRRFKAGDHPHLAAFVVVFDNTDVGGTAEPVRVLRTEWLA